MARTKSIPKASTPTPPKAEDEAAGKKQRRWKAGTVALREIKRYQAGTNLLIGVAPVHRLIKEIDQEIHNGTRHRFKRSALQALHVCAEEYLQVLFANTIKVAVHAKSQTIRPGDLRLAMLMQP